MAGQQPAERPHSRLDGQPDLPLVDVRSLLHVECGCCCAGVLIKCLHLHVRTRFADAVAVLCGVRALRPSHIASRAGGNMLDGSVPIALASLPQLQIM